MVMSGQLYAPSTGTTGYVAETRYTEWQTEIILWYSYPALIVEVGENANRCTNIAIQSFSS
jgi:hypothetical protein